MKKASLIALFVVVIGAAIFAFVDRSDVGMGEANRVADLQKYSDKVNIEKVYPKKESLAMLAGKRLRPALKKTAKETSNKQLTLEHKFTSDDPNNKKREREKPISGSFSARQSKPYVPGELIVKYKSGVTKSVQTGVRDSVNAQVKKKLDLTGSEYWKLGSDITVFEAMKKLRADPAIEYVEPNYRRYPRAVPNDPGFSQQWGMQNVGQLINDPSGAVTGTAAADMNLVKAWDITTGSKNVIVAVIDDSLEYDHPDLAANMWNNPGEIAGDGIDNDGNGFIDDVYGWDFRDQDNDPRGVPNQDGHGTAVAGCIGAVGNNGIGVVGANWDVSIMAIRMAFDSASIIASFDYAIANGAKIINASFGGPFYSQAEFDAVKRLEAAGILLVAAAGNNDVNNDQVFDAPSGYYVPNILSVAASDPNDDLVTWSHYGTTSVDVASPGINIYTTMLPRGVSMGNSGADGISYDYIQGTSFSSPFVAGIAALIKSQYPQATYQELKGRIMAAASLPANQVQTVRRGVLATDGLADAHAALTLAQQPVLVVRDIRVDDAAGNNNGQLDPGESTSLWIDLENTWQDASNISATLSSADPAVTISNPTASYPALVSGANAQSLVPFSVTLDAGVAAHAR
ncbi:MAG: S8 family serine peptidase, partial [Mariprofundaceae bacterium]